MATHSPIPVSEPARPTLGQGATVSAAGTAPLDNRDLPSLSTTSNAGQASGRDIFRSLDSGNNLPPGAWIHAGAHRAEAGYLDPSLGWIGVRAEALPGGVHASLVPSSAEAAQVLVGHVGGLNSFLSERHAQPATVTLVGAETGSNSLSTGTGSQGTDQGHSGTGQSYTGSQQQTRASGTPMAEPVTGTRNAGPAEFSAWPAGEHISVVA